MDRTPYPSEQKELETVMGAAPLQCVIRLPLVVLKTYPKEPAAVVAPPSEHAMMEFERRSAIISYGS
jgi:hypothetical protein